MTNAHDFTLETLEGEQQALADYAGQVLLIVNVASACGLTPQYAGLQELHEKRGDDGLRVLGFPCNQFAGQEPGSAEEIRSFCDTNFSVSFPLFAKLEVNGPGRHPLYAWLTEQPTEPEGAGDVKWNFGKFLVGKDGAVLARFEPTTPPDDPALLERIDDALKA